MNAAELLANARIKGSYKAINHEKITQNNLSPKAFFGEYNKVRGSYEVKTTQGAYLPRQNRLNATPGKGEKAEGFRLTHNGSEITFPRPRLLSIPKEEDISYNRPQPFIFSPSGMTSTSTPFSYDLPFAPKGSSFSDGISRVVWSNLTNFVRLGKGAPSPARPIELAFDFTSKVGPENSAHGITVNFLPNNFTGSGFTFTISDLRTRISPTGERLPNKQWNIRQNDIQYDQETAISTGSTVLSERNDELPNSLNYEKNRVMIKYDGKKILTKHSGGELSADFVNTSTNPLNFFSLFIARPFFESADLPKSDQKRLFAGSQQSVSRISFGRFSAIGPDGKWRQRPVNLTYGRTRKKGSF